MIIQSSGVVIDLTPRVKTDDLIPPGSSMLLSISTFLTDVAHTLKNSHTLSWLHQAAALPLWS